MTQNLRKIIIWFAGLAIYFLSVAVVLALLLDASSNGFEEQSSLADVMRGVEQKPFSEKWEKDESVQGVLIPLGPDDGLLPGFPEIWDEFLLAAEETGFDSDTSGFDGMQAVRNIVDLSRGAVKELFVSSQPVSISRIKDTLYLLNSDGRIEQIDCTYPMAPVRVSSLPFPPVEKLIVKGTRGFLLLKKTGHINNKIIVLDLSDPEKIEQIAKLTLPGPVANFFFLDDRLLTYENPGGENNGQYMALYDVTEKYQLQQLAHIKSPVLERPAIFLDHFLLTPDLRDGLNIFDFNDPLQPTLIVRLPLKGKIHKMARLGHRLLAEGGNDKFYIIDLQDITKPTLVNEIDEAHYMAYLLDMGNYSYYFSDNGYLRVFDTPLSHLSRLNNNDLKPFNGTLLEKLDGNGFFFLGGHNKLQQEVTGWPVSATTAKIVDTAVWRGYHVLLDEAGALTFLRYVKGGHLFFVKQINLPDKYRWLAASETHLYTGGRSLAVIGDSASGGLEYLRSLPVADTATLDGIVIHEILAIADGKRGVKLFSLSEPSRPEARGEISFPEHVKPLVDARQLAWSGQRLLLAAGRAGLVVATLGADENLYFDDALKFSSPLSALTVVNDFCLASDKKAVHVVDIRQAGTLQRLGKVAFAGVERFAVSKNGLWGGYVRQEGWTLLPAPRIVSSAELSGYLEDERSADDQVARYRLRLFDDHNVVGLPGVFSFAALSRYDLFGEVDAAN